jgi:surfactin family lipopeptide synthetase A
MSLSSRALLPILICICLELKALRMKIARKCLFAYYLVRNHMLQQYIAHNSLIPFYLSWQLEPNGSNYNLSFSYTLENDDNVNFIIDKLQELIRLKAYLRQTFVLKDGQLVASVHDDLPAEVNFFTSSLSDFSQLEQVLAKQPHDINVKSAVKLSVIRFNDSSHSILLFNIHHILLDGVELENFITDLNHLLANKEVKYESPKDYISRVVCEPPLEECGENGIAALYLTKLNEIADKVCYPAINNRQNTFYSQAVLPKSLAQKLKSLSEQYQLSIFNLLLLAWGTFLAKLFNQDYTLVNYPVNIRSDKTINGCFINMVIFPMVLTEESNYLSLIDACKEDLALYKRLAKVRLTDISDMSSIPGFAVSNFIQPSDLVIQNKHYIAQGYSQIAHANLSLKYREKGDKLYFGCDIVADMFSESLTSSLLSRFFTYLTKLFENVATPLTKLDLTFEQERQRLLYEFNNTDKAYPQDKMIHQLFEEQVERTPDAIAVVFEDQKLTYRELNEKSNCLARYLKSEYQKLTQKTLMPDTLIAICVERSLEMIIGILGILKAGAAYLPIDPEYPQERIEFILKDADCVLLLTQDYLLRQLSTISKSVKKIALDQIDYQKESGQNLESQCSAKNLAYVMYTSGTTGNPKGVMIEHRSVNNVLNVLYDVYQLEKNKRVTAYTNYVFDVSVSEFFTVLTGGGELYLLGKERKDLDQLTSYLNKKNINAAYLPPAVLSILPKIQYPTLHTLIFAGEPCNQTTGRYWLTQCELYNYYGPTEATIYATGKKVISRNINEIGYPLANVRAYVLDRHLNLMPIGGIGELYLGGACLARGYLKREDLTKACFIDNPFATESDKEKNYKVLYKTGDLVRWLEDGNLEYLGRNDSQIKLRGYRIELGEIEKVLSTYPGVKQSIVLLKEKKQNKYLIGYYVSETKLNELDIQKYLAQHLPDYMLPSMLVNLEGLPLTVSGKLNKKALPEPEFINVQSYVAPRNEKEQFICEAFAKVLDLEKVGIESDFFSLGGNSLKAIALTAKLQVNFKINIIDIFNLKTPKQIARKVEFAKDNLRQQLEKIKLAYQAENNKNIFGEQDYHKLDEYLAAVKKLPKRYNKKPICNVLLTGVPGYLGCNLLNQLLKLTDYNIYLLIRAKSAEEAFNRLNQSYQFYFNEMLDNLLGSRLFIFEGDIEKSNLGLAASDYQTLASKIDSIIHGAAFTKHYGEYDRFYSANVQATIHLLELCKLTALKDFHFVSTISVLRDCGPSQQKLLMEEDFCENAEEQLSPYIRTKHEAELAVIKYRDQGIKASIYRLGNLAFMWSNHCVQQNINDSAFFSRLQCFIKLKVAAQEIGKTEISPVDLTAQAIVRLFDKLELSNGVYHVFDPNLCNIAEFFAADANFAIKIQPLSEFINTILNYLNNPTYQKYVERFLLHQGWLEKDYRPPNAAQVLQNKTNFILGQLNFKWPIIPQKVFRNYVRKAYQLMQEGLVR